MFHHGVGITVSNKHLRINEIKRGHILEMGVFTISNFLEEEIFGKGSPVFQVGWDV